MRFFSICILSGTFLFLSACSRKTEPLSTEKEQITDSLKQAPIPAPPIKNPLKTYKLKLLITNNINTFFIYKGETFGLEYELLKLFLASKKIDLEIELIKDGEHIRDSVLALGAHMAAATFVFPENTADKVLYSDPIYTTDLVLVKHKDNPKRAVQPVVIKDAPYMRYLYSADPKRFKNIHLNYSTDNASTQHLLMQVHDKEIESTIANANEAALVSALYQDIAIDSILEKNVPVTFMFHPEMDSLQTEFNNWLKKNKNSTDYRWILQKYEMLPKKISQQLAIRPIHSLSRKISIYDKLIKEYSSRIHWDWRLTAALIHQESKFNPSTKSWAGACGLMQVMPKTAYHNSHITKKQLFVPLYNIKAGTQYLQWLESNYFKDSMMLQSEKQKLILASYNAGAGHVTDAQALCVKYHLDPTIWDNNVEKMILAKSDPKYYNDPVCKYGYCRGQETSTYVKNILFYYKNYSHYFKE